MAGEPSKRVVRNKDVKEKGRKSSEPKKKHYYDGERVIGHLRLPDVLRDSMQARAKTHGITYYEEWDRAVEWFLAHVASVAPVQYEATRARKAGASYKTVWIAVKLMDKLRRVAERDDVSVARVVHTAAVRYLQAAEPT